MTFLRIKRNYSNIKPKRQGTHQVAVVEVIFEADAGAQEAHGRDYKPLFAPVEQLQHLLHYIVAQHVVPAHTGAKIVKTGRAKTQLDTHSTEHYPVQTTPLDWHA